MFPMEPSLTLGTAGARGSQSSITFGLGDNQYLARKVTSTPQHLQTLWISSDTAQTPSLATYFHVQKNQVIDAQSLRLWRANGLEKDDVFSPEFLGQVILGGIDSIGEVHLTEDAHSVFREWGTLIVAYGPKLDLANGPYFIDDHGIFCSIWKVHQDRQLAFLQATWPSAQDNQSFEQIEAPGNGYRSHGIAVPSRSYNKQLTLFSFGHNQAPAAEPLKGLRIAIKDNYHIRGTKTSLGNRAYYEIYPTQEQSAVVVSKLLDVGAHVVGKSHLSSFAMMEHPTQSVDFQAPFNPRGDGYLIPGGSSSGSAVAVAAYDWLDVAICSDTTGSSRIPALQNGVFGFRPSTNAISGEGMVPAWPGFDVPAWVGRDLSVFSDIFNVLSGTSNIEPGVAVGSPTTIIYPQDFIPEGSPEQEQAMDSLLEDIVKASGYVLKRVSIHNDWKDSAPVEERDLQRYLHHLTRHGWFYSAFHSFKSFRAQFEKSNGHLPFVTEVVRWYWKIGQEVSPEEHEEIMSRFDVFKKWFTDRYMDHESNVVALHIDKVMPRYRDQYPGDINPEVPGLRQTFISAVLGAPELAIPISECSYDSRITGKKEMIPIVISLMGTPGTDSRLLKWTLHVLKETGRPTRVKVGKTAF